MRTAGLLLLVRTKLCFIYMMYIWEILFYMANCWLCLFLAFYIRRMDLYIILENIRQSVLAISWCLHLHPAFRSLKQTPQLHLNTLKIHSRMCCNAKASKEKGGESNEGNDLISQEGNLDLQCVIKNYTGVRKKRRNRRLEESFFFYIPTKDRKYCAVRLQDKITKKQKVNKIIVLSL